MKFTHILTGYLSLDHTAIQWRTVSIRLFALSSPSPVSSSVEVVPYSYVMELPDTDTHIDVQAADINDGVDPRELPNGDPRRKLIRDWVRAHCSGD